METKRIVDINTYWATIVKDTAQFGQIAVAENPEFNRLADCIFRALKDSFIHSATEYGVKRWESMLQIAPSAGDTLEDRKARILTYLNMKLPYTWRVLKQLIEGIVGEDKVTLDYVNDEGKLVVHTDRLSDEKLQTVRDLIERVVPMNLVVEQYNHHIDISWREFNKYAECTTLLEMFEVDPEWQKDITSDKEWIYPLTNMLKSGAKYQEMKNNFCPVKAETFYIYLPNATSFSWSFFNNRIIKKAEIYAPKVNNIDAMFRWCTNLEEVTGYAPNITSLYLVVSDDTKLKKWTIELPKLKKGEDGFRRSILDKESTLIILGSIPTYTSGTHKLPIGIHVDHQADTDVLSAIANAETKGWTLTVQWNGTPTSGISTLDLEEIYARVTESEYGDYTDENGTRCSLDWGHYVTDTTGYKLFFSIYEAEQYFKLTKIEGIEQ